MQPDLSYAVSSKPVYPEERYESLMQETLLEESMNETEIKKQNDLFLAQALDMLEEQVNYYHLRGERGEVFVKPNKKGKMKYTTAFLSLARGRLCWLQTGVLGSVTTKPHYIEIRHIVSVERGQHSTNFALANALQPINDSTKARSFTVTTHNRTVDLVARSPSVCAVWVRVLELLSARAAQAPVGSIFPSYVDEQWCRADLDRKGSIDLSKALKLVRKLNAEWSAPDVAAKFQKADTADEDELGREGFKRFMEELFDERDEIKDLIQKIRIEAAPETHPGVHAALALAQQP